MDLIPPDAPLVPHQIDAGHTLSSSLREKVLEHLFVGELLRALWRQGVRNVEVLRAEVDAGGYDLVIECNSVLRHIQLKSSYRGAKTATVNVNLGISEKPCGCMIWIMFDQGTLELGPFLWFGGPCEQKIPDLGERIGRHSKGTSLGTKNARPRIRLVSKGRFRSQTNIDTLACELFGNLHS